MKIGIISDTHDHLPNIRKAVDLFIDERVDLIIHCGDYVAPFVKRAMTKLQEIDPSISVWGVFGNNDGERVGLKKIAGDIISFKGEFFEFEKKGKKFAVYHGTDLRLLENIIQSRLYDVVLTGHTHQPKVEMRDSTLVVNPGEGCGYLTGTATCAVLELAEGKLSPENVHMLKI